MVTQFCKKCAGPFPESAYGKYVWVNEQLKTRNVLIGQPKEICAQPGTWLIDDRAGYGPRWESRGGRLLSLKRPWNPNGLSHGIEVFGERQLHKDGIALRIGIAGVDLRFDDALFDVGIEMIHFVTEAEFFGHFAFCSDITRACWIFSN